MSEDLEFPLETFENPRPEQSYLIESVTPEFTCLCPMTGQPDFATIRLRYVPGPQCIELKSFKLYLRCFRNAGHFHEDVTNRMLSKFVEAIQPVWMEVRGEFNVRGGVATTVTARHGELPENLAGIESASWNGPN